MIEIFVVFLFLASLLIWSPRIFSTAKRGAPFVPMEPDVVMRVIRLAKIKKNEILYDLGSGDGRVVIAAALAGANSIGVDIYWPRILYSRAWIWFLRLSHRAKIIRQNFFTVDLSDADIVCLFLLQKTNQNLKEKLERELKPGARVLSYAFTFEGWHPAQIDPNNASVYGPIYLYVR